MEKENIEGTEVKDPVVEEQTEEKQETGFVQKRVQRAERQTKESILSELGAESLDEIKERLVKVEEYQSELEKLKKDQLRQKRVGELKKRLSDENVFDPDVLIPFVNIDELDDSPESYDNEVKKLKEFKPNHFGTKKVVGDEHQPSQEQVKVDKVKEAEERGDYVSSIAEWIRVNK